mmetsp:Transcript_85812/g.251252  ORF Transcript_85812/g.251252 Transcript_85812/m.251252 type:complete len:384 (-) Transcript_85812:27-1178(-)
MEGEKDDSVTVTARSQVGDVLFGPEALPGRMLVADLARSIELRLLSGAVATRLRLSLSGRPLDASDSLAALEHSSGEVELQVAFEMQWIHGLHVEYAGEPRRCSGRTLQKGCKGIVKSISGEGARVQFELGLGTISVRREEVSEHVTREQQLSLREPVMLTVRNVAGDALIGPELFPAQAHVAEVARRISPVQLATSAQLLLGSREVKLCDFLGDLSEAGSHVELSAVFSMSFDGDLEADFSGSHCRITVEPCSQEYYERFVALTERGRRTPYVTTSTTGAAVLGIFSSSEEMRHGLEEKPSAARSLEALMRGCEHVTYFETQRSDVKTLKPGCSYLRQETTTITVFAQRHRIQFLRTVDGEVFHTSASDNTLTTIDDPSESS